MLLLLMLLLPPTPFAAPWHDAAPVLRAAAPEA